MRVSRSHPTVQSGSQGQSVRELQTRLKNRGFDPGPIDGVFGDRTRSAVRKFQASRGLSVDGVAGPRTWGALSAAKKPSGGGGGGGSSKAPVLQQGARGPAVKILQRLLARKGFNPGAADGDFGPNTLTAVRRFQASRDLTRDGVVGPRTWKALGADGIKFPRNSGGTGGGLRFPLPYKPTIIGRPYQGTHSIGNWQSDNALDFSIPAGTPIYAVANGRIGSKIGPLNSSNPRLAGQRLTLETGNNGFYYAHLSRLNVRAGQRVQKGDLLGWSGSANGSPHLHLGVRRGNPSAMFGV